VDDLAAVVEAGALSDLTGAWPMADDYPCPTAEVARWCARLLLADLASAWQQQMSAAGRKVDGRKIRELLDSELRYPEYQSGILASLVEENCALHR
jgi:hypothetical protein